MAGLTDLAEEVVLNLLLNGQLPAPWTTIYFGLFTATPSDTGGGTEVPSANAYVRIGVTAGFTVSGGQGTNTGTVEWPSATGSWGTISHIGIFDSLTAGNLLAYGAITTPRAIVSTDVVKFLAEELVVNLD